LPFHLSGRVVRPGGAQREQRRPKCPSHCHRTAQQPDTLRAQLRNELEVDLTVCGRVQAAGVPGIGSCEAGSSRRWVSLIGVSGRSSDVVLRKLREVRQPGWSPMACPCKRRGEAAGGACLRGRRLLPAFRRSLPDLPAEDQHTSICTSKCQAACHSGPLCGALAFKAVAGKANSATCTTNGLQQRSAFAASGCSGQDAHTPR